VPIYVAYAGNTGGLTLENREIASDPHKVWERTLHAVGRGVMKLSILDDSTRTYVLRSDAPAPGAFFDTQYRVNVSHRDGSFLPEQAQVIIPGHGIMNDYEYPYPVMIDLPIDNIDGSHIAPIVSTGRGQGYELMEPGNAGGPYQRKFSAAGLVLRGAVFHDNRLFDGTEPFRYS
jgi:hypothetical protein